MLRENQGNETLNKLFNFQRCAVIRLLYRASNHVLCYRGPRVVDDSSVHRFVTGREKLNRYPIMLLTGLINEASGK